MGPRVFYFTHSTEGGEIGKIMQEALLESDRIIHGKKQMIHTIC